MFPAIKTAKPRLKDPTDGVLRQHRRLWQATRLILEENRQALLAKPTNQQTVNILKVWRIRQVPEFYGLYFLYFVASLSEPQQTDLIAKEINDTLSSKSWWFSINRKKLEREAALGQLRGLLHILEAFDCMNSNRSDPEGERHIKTILATCQSLQEIKQAEESKFREFSECIAKLRKLTYQLISEVEAWRSSLATIHGTDMFDRLNKIQIMFVDNEMNLLVAVLYDSGFVAQSFLKRWMNFVEKNDPFFIEILKERPQNRIQTLVLEGLRDLENSDTVLKMVYKLTQQLNTKDVLLPHPSNRSSKRGSKESIKSQTPREKIVSPKKAEALKQTTEPQKNEINIISSRNKIEIIYSKKKDLSLSKTSDPKKLYSSKESVSPNSKRVSVPLSDKSLVAEEADKVKELNYRRLSIQKEKLERELEKERKKRELELNQRDRQEEKGRDIDYRRLSIEKEKLERELEKERRKQQKEAQEFSKKFDRLDRELEKFREAEKLMRLEKRDRVTSSQDRPINNDSVSRVYKRMGGSKGFLAPPTTSNDERQNLKSEKFKLEKALDSERKRQTKEVVQYERKLQKYDEELAKVKEERNQQRSRLRQIEREKEEKIKLKEQQLLTIKKYIKEELKSKPGDNSPYQNLDQYKSRNSSNANNEHPQSDIEKEHIKERMNIRRRIEEIYASNGSRRSQESSSRYNSLNRSESGSSSARMESIEIVYDKKSRKLMAVAKKDGRAIKEFKRPEVSPSMNRTIKQEQEEQVKKNTKLVAEVYGSKNSLRKMAQSISSKNSKELQQQQKRQETMRLRDLQKQKKAMTREYEDKIERQRNRYKNEMDLLEQRLKNRELELLNEIKTELAEQKALGQQRDQQLAQEQKARLEIQREKMLIQQEKERLALEVETKRLKEELEKQIRQELLQIGDLRKEQEQADAERRLREEAIRQEIQMLEKLRNEQIVKLDDENDQLRKVLLSRKRKLAKATTEESELIQAEKTYQLLDWKLKTQPADAPIHEQGGGAIQRPNTANNLKQYSVILSRQMEHSSKRTKTIHTESLLAELQDKSDMQRVMTQQLLSRYKDAERAPQVAERDEIEMLVRRYRETGSELKPRTSSPSLEKRQPRKSDQFLAAAITNKSKKEIIDELLNNRKEREKFEKELEAKGAHLRPTLSRQSANQLYFKNFMDLRVQSELNTLGDFRERHKAALNLADEYCNDELETDERTQPQPRTIRQHILAHQKQLDQQYKKIHDKKNFFKINKEKLKPPVIKEEDNKPQKPVKLSEEVLRRQEEALKKYVNRSKGKPEKQQRSISKKKFLSNKQEKIVVVEKLDENVPSSDRENSRVSPPPIQPVKNESQNTFKTNKQQKQQQIVKDSTAKLSDSAVNKSQNSIKPPSRADGNTPKGLDVDLSRIPTENSQKQITEPIEEYKQEEDYHRLLEEHEKKLADQRSQEKIRLSQQREEEQRKKQRELSERLKFEEEERLKQEKIVKYRGIINDMLRLADYSVYQEVVDQSQLRKYLEDYERMSSADLQKINKFNILEALDLCQKEISYHILIAKDSKSLEKGIGLFRKDGATYLCDHLTTHQINTLSEVALSISRQVFLWDVGCERIEFYLHFDEADIQHANIYQSFEQLCIDYGQVYQVRGDILKRKYVIKRSLFVDEKKVGVSLPQQNNMAVGFHTELFIGDKNTLQLKSEKKLKEYQQKQAIEDDRSPYEIAVQLLLTEQIKNVLSLQEFQGLKQKIKANLRLKELMLTTVLMEKKGLTVDEFIKQKYTKMKQLAQIQPELFEEAEPVTVPLHYCAFQESFPLTAKLKICRLTVEVDPISYIGITVGGPTITATCSNYNTPSYFLTLSPKHKLLFMDASEFIALTQTNPEIDLFFYLKHYIKNIADFVKEEYPVVYIPRVDTNATFQHLEMRQVLQRSLFTQDRVHFGDHRMASSIRMEPSYKDLVIKPPFLLCVLSGKLQRASSGTPLYARLVTVADIM